MTTNAGAADMARENFGFTRAKREGEDIEAINKMFTPEFRNRLDAIVPFGRLPEEVISKVVDKFILQLEAQLADRNVTVELTDESRAWLVEHGYDEAMGARPMSRVIQKSIKTPLADEVLFGKLKNGGAVKIVVVTDEKGTKTLDFVYPEGPVLPRPERDIVEAGKKRDTDGKRARSRAVPDGTDEAGEPEAPSSESGGGGSVPKVPLKLQ